MNELGEFVKHDAEFKALNIRIVAISVDSPEQAQWVHQKLNTPFPILSDSKKEVMELYGTRSPEYRNREGNSLNTPTLVLIDKAGKVRWIHQATNFRVRASVEEDLAEARKLK
jgi:peroxiredoxin